MVELNFLGEQIFIRLIIFLIKLQMSVLLLLFLQPDFNWFTMLNTGTCMITALVNSICIRQYFPFVLSSQLCNEHFSFYYFCWWTGACFQFSTSKLQEVYCFYKYCWNFLDCWRCRVSRFDITLHNFLEVIQVLAYFQTDKYLSVTVWFLGCSNLYFRQDLQWLIMQ